ncbi:hypothetical protein ABLE68_20710 [Nocardioides sp. CN2-186]|uniref:hypothetical protein n=1 Tax=Nocardioides tweenelious TaxID=3156607 RepID=UPI0032B4BEBE
MSRNIIKLSATMLAATATTGALVLASPGLANAATISHGFSDSERSAVDGSGDADAQARATDSGRLSVSTKADGGDTTGPLGGVTSTETRASANASFSSKRIAVAKGTYRVVFTYQGLKGNQDDRGDASNAKVTRNSVVHYVAQSGGSAREVHRTQQVDQRKGTERTVLLINIPNGSSGYLKVRALLSAVSTADGSGSFAKGNASVTDVKFKVNRV